MIANRGAFIAQYVKELHAEYDSNAAWLAMLANNPRNPTIEALAERMTDGLPAGRSNKDSPAIKRTCKALGIKHTYKDIARFLQQVQS